MLHPAVSMSLSAHICLDLLQEHLLLAREDALVLTPEGLVEIADDDNLALTARQAEMALEDLSFALPAVVQRAEDGWEVHLASPEGK